MKTTRLEPILRDLDTFTVSTQGALGALTEEWQSLQNACSRATPFQTVAFASACAKHLGHAEQLAIVGVRDHGLLVGIAPFVSRRRLGLPCLEPLGAGHVGYFGLIAWHDRIDVVEAMALHVAGAYPAALLHFPYVDVQNHLVTVFISALATQGWRSRSWVRNVSHRVLGEGGFERYLSSKSGKTRQNVRRWRRLLERGREVRLEVHEGIHLTDEVHRRICRVQQLSWLARRGQTSLASPVLRGQVAALAASGSAEALLLTVDGEDVAYMLNYRHGGNTYLVMTGFDERWAGLAPGKVMWGMALETVFRRSDQLLDFLFGDAEYKRFWGNQTTYVLRTVAWRGARGWLLGCLPHRLHGWIARHESLRVALLPIQRLIQSPPSVAAPVDDDSHK